MELLDTNKNLTVFLTAGLGAKKYKLASRRLLEQAIRFGYFQSYWHLDEEFLEFIYEGYEQEFLAKYTKGYGYWAWKPIFIKYVFDHLCEGDYLIYMDGGCEIFSSLMSQEKYKKYLNLAELQGILCFGTGRIELDYTSNHIFDYFSISNDNVVMSSEQHSASIIIICKNKKSQEIIDQWYKAVFYNDRFLLRDDLTQVPHRHDQSLLSVICKINDIYPKGQDGYFQDSDYMISNIPYQYPFHTMRNQTKVSLIIFFRFIKNPIIRGRAINKKIAIFLRKVHMMAFG